MTAVIAFVDADRVFMAADTKRTGAPMPVRKIHVWSERVLLGQAGNGPFMKRAIDAAFACQFWNGDDLSAAIHAFDQARKAIYPAALAANSKAPGDADGTLLIAACADLVRGHELWTIELDPSVPPRQHAAPIHAIGLPNAASRSTALYPTAVGSGILPAWTKACMITFACSTVDWPADMVLAAPSTAGGRIVAQQRLAGATDPHDPIFD